MKHGSILQWLVYFRLRMNRECSKKDRIYTLIVKVARSHPLALPFTGFGGSGLTRFGSIAVAIIRADKIFPSVLGAANLRFLPIELDNILQ